MKRNADQSPGGTECTFCEREIPASIEYFSIEACPDCYSRLELSTAAAARPEKDRFLEQFLSPEDRIFLDALNAYAALFDKTQARHILRILLSNLDDPEMNGILRTDFFLAARAVSLCGHEDVSREPIDADKLHVLTTISNHIVVAIISKALKSLEPKERNRAVLRQKVLAETDRVITAIVENLHNVGDEDVKRLVEEIDRDAARMDVSISGHLRTVLFRGG